MKEIKVLNKGKVVLLNHMGDDQSIANSARISYSKGTKKVSNDSGLIRYLMRNWHTTPFEMVELQFYIKAPIFVFRQWHRHRTWSFNEVSGRYSELPDEFYIPEENKITTQSKYNKQGGTDNIMEDPAGLQEQFIDEANEDFSLYGSRLEKGMRKELARINLPLSTYSEMYAKVDLHNLFHFLRLRLDSHAQYEIRVYAEAIAELIKPIVPIAYKAFEDYRLNSIQLSSLDAGGLICILDLLISSKPPEEEKLDPWLDKTIESTADAIFSNKREKAEFLNKLQTLLPFRGITED